MCAFTRVCSHTSVSARVVEYVCVLVCVCARARECVYFSSVSKSLCVGGERWGGSVGK